MAKEQNFYLTFRNNRDTYVRIVAANPQQAHDVVTSRYSPFLWDTLYPEIRFDKRTFALGESYAITAREYLTQRNLYVEEARK